MTTYSSSNWSDEPIVDLRRIISRLWACRWWMVGCTVVVTFLITATAFMMTPVYQVTAVMVPTSAERDNLGGALGSALGSVGGLASLAGIGLGSGDSVTQEALAVLRSRQFTEQFIKDLNLMPRLFADLWDQGKEAWLAEVKKPPTPARAFKYFDTRIRTVTHDKKTGLVKLQIEWTDPQEAAAWANELVKRLNEEMRARAIEKSEASTVFLEKELADTSMVETRQAINRLMEGQIKQRMLANVTHEYVFRVVDRALPPDKDDPIRPKKLLLIAAGPIVGFALAMFGVLVFDWSRGREPVPGAANERR
jgi:uncharacterized protein involved in exopolysaccharide biosynthesis